MHTITYSQPMINIRNNHMCSERSVTKIEKIAKDIAKFSSYQYCNGAALIIQTAFRAYHARKERTRIKSEWNQTRADAFANLIKREKTYVLNLATVVSQYIMPLHSTSDKQLKQIAGDLKLIFSNLEQIIPVHHTFLESIYKLTEKNWPNLEGLGDLFISISPHWQHYGIYVHNFKFARDILFECINKCEKFSQFLDERTMTLSTDLNMLLSLPLNHIAGYELILKKLLNETEEGSPEHTSLLQAVILTEETSNFIANALGKATNVANIERIKRSVVDLPPKICLEISKPSSQYKQEKFVEFGVSGTKKLQGGTLFIFQNLIILAVASRGLHYRTSFDLSTLTVNASETDSRGFSILIIDEEKSAYDNIVEGSQFDILAVSDQARDQIVRDLKELISLNQRTRTFGVHLEHILEREKPLDGIPRVVKDLISYLDKHGLNDMGLFRIPGTSTIVKKIRFEYNQAFVTGRYPKLEEIPDFQPNDASGLLKMFFHDLPEPLLPYRMYYDFLSSQVDYDEPADKKARLKELINSLPDANYKILKYLIEFFIRVVANQQVNKMGAENVAMCFGPNILQPEEQTIDSTLAIPKTNSCIAWMITDFDFIFQK